MITVNLALPSSLVVTQINVNTRGSKDPDLFQGSLAHGGCSQKVAKVNTAARRQSGTARDYTSAFRLIPILDGPPSRVHEYRV